MMKLSRMTPTQLAGKVFLYLIMFFGDIITIFPFYYMFVISTRGLGEIFVLPIPMWFGNDVVNNLEILLSKFPFFRILFNSVFIATTNTLLTLFFCSLGGYTFAKFDFKLKGPLFAVMMATMMIPALLSIIPWFLMMKIFGWIDTFYPLIVPGVANAFGIFLMRSFMLDIPDDLLDSARIDGCGEFSIFWRIALPVSKPALGALAIFTFVSKWKEFMGPLIILQSKHLLTIPVALSKLKGNRATPYGAIMLGTVIGVVPLLIAFVLASKRFIAGLTEGSLKG